jgi:hemolysin-activating ACP:hemolysin acyltransferase
MDYKPLLQLRTFDNRSMALGLAVEYLMKKPAFARIPFGHWSRVLTGQIKRGHYTFVVGGKRVVGFGGWALMTEAEAEAWVTGTQGATEVSGTIGDCIVVNAWAADTPDANRMIMNGALAAAKKYRMLYAKREYADGRSRPLRFTVEDFIETEAAKALDLFYLSSPGAKVP